MSALTYKTSTNGPFVSPPLILFPCCTSISKFKDWYKLTIRQNFYVFVDGWHQRHVDSHTFHRSASWVKIAQAALTPNCKGPPQGPLVCPWGVVP